MPSRTVNLTVTADRDALQRARARASQAGTSVNAVLREQLRRHAAGDLLPAVPNKEVNAKIKAQRQQAVRDLLRIAQEPRPLAEPAQSTLDANGNRSWTRDELYER